MFNRRVVLHADQTVVKSGKRIALGEAEALKVASRAGIPAPRIRDAYFTADSQGCIRIDYIKGQPLDTLWPDMSVQEKWNIALQLWELVEKMRSVAPPAHLNGACDGTEIPDTRLYSTYYSPACRDAGAFNDFSLSGLYEYTPLSPDGLVSL